MKNGIELTLARRLAWKQPGQKRVSAAVGVAIAGVALSILVMLLSVAIMRGFKNEVRQSVFSLSDAITLTGYDDEENPAPFPMSEPMTAITLPQGVKAEGHTSISSILKTPDDFLAVSLEGNNAIPADSLNSLFLSRQQASALNLSVGDKIPAYFFIDNRLRVRALRVDSIYSTTISEHDREVAYCSPLLPGRLRNLPDGYVQTIGFSNVNPDDVKSLAAELHSQLLTAYYSGRLSGAYALTDIYQTDSQFFSWLNLIDTNVIVILILMSIVAAVTLISSLFIIILERVKTIGLLKALGAPNRMIRHVFMLMAERLVCRGLLWGNLLALIIIAIQHFTHIIPLDPASYYVDHVPVNLSLGWFIGINLGALILSWLILILPAITIARISPAQTMRYE